MGLGQRPAEWCLHSDSNAHQSGWSWAQAPWPPSTAILLVGEKGQVGAVSGFGRGQGQVRAVLGWGSKVLIYCISQGENVKVNILTPNLDLYTVKYDTLLLMKW